MSITAYKDHPLSELLPLMDDSEIEGLATDIQQHGQRAPITLYENKILDGRNRYRACQIANIEPRVRHFTSGDAVAFIVSVNVLRRHLNTSQRALVAAKLANLSNGQHRASSANLPSTSSISEIAKELKVSPRTVTTAREVLRTAPRRQVQAVERGEKTVRAVAIETRAKGEAKEKHFDKTGFAIPDEVYEDWREAESFSELLCALHRIKLRVEKAVKEDELVFREISNTTVSTLKNAWSELQQILPYSICPTCQGRTRRTCTVCKQRGFVSEFGYRHWFPKETLELREKAKR